MSETVVERMARAMLAELKRQDALLLGDPGTIMTTAIQIDDHTKQ
jgi:hypothetical protein